MDNKVYYGEYTLKHWVDLMLTKNIILPEYQRYFVWDRKQSISLLKSIGENQFIPPVTIGCYRMDGNKYNLILDGQQRLTSILLAYFNLFPTTENKKIKESELYFANENDEDIDDSSSNDSFIIEWNFNKLLKMIDSKRLRNKEEIHDEGISCGYEPMFEQKSQVDFDKFYIGFSFILPATDNENAQQEFYSKVFRSINIEGKHLLPLESREALYYLNRDLAGLFSPDFSKNIKVNDGKMDFVRYLSLLSQCINTGIDNVARGYTKQMELYYENFIYAAVAKNKTREFLNLSEVIKDYDYESRMKNLVDVVKALNLEREYDSIIDIDMYMFGIVYHTIFMNRKIDPQKYVELDKKINNKINDIKKVALHVKNPSALKHLKSRIDGSVRICEEYLE